MPAGMARALGGAQAGARSELGVGGCDAAGEAEERGMEVSLPDPTLL